MRRVLLIDDEEPSGIAIRVLLEANGCQVAIKHDSPKALEAIRNYKPEVVLVNFPMPKAHGNNVACQLAKDQNLSQTRLILYSQLRPEEVRPKLPSSDIPILEKPICAEELLRLIHQCA